MAWQRRGEWIVYASDFTGLLFSETSAACSDAIHAFYRCLYLYAMHDQVFHALGPCDKPHSSGLKSSNDITTCVAPCVSVGFRASKFSSGTQTTKGGQPHVLELRAICAPFMPAARPALIPC